MDLDSKKSRGCLQPAKDVSYESTHIPDVRFFSMAKRKRSEASVHVPITPVPLPPTLTRREEKGSRSSQRKASSTNPDINKEILNSQDALRASPSAVDTDETFEGPRKEQKTRRQDSDISTSRAVQTEGDIVKLEVEDPENEPPEAVEDMEAALSRPPPVHSDHLPLPWKGRLGYVSNQVMDESN
jgi:hypothetical protein